MRGVTRGWKIVEVPASGQIFNVSALVVPEPMPASDDRQVPLFPEDVLRELLELAKRQAETVQELTHINRELVQNARDARNGLLKRMPADTPSTVGRKHRPHRPQLHALREWHACRAYYQRLEHDVRRDLQLDDDDEVTKDMVHKAGGPSVRTTTRTMVDYYGLLPDQWPPSTWPEEPPVRH